MSPAFLPCCSPRSRRLLHLRAPTPSILPSNGSPNTILPSDKLDVPRNPGINPYAGLTPGDAVKSLNAWLQAEISMGSQANTPAKAQKWFAKIFEKDLPRKAALLQEAHPGVVLHATEDFHFTIEPLESPKLL